MKMELPDKGEMLLDIIRLKRENELYKSIIKEAIEYIKSYNLPEDLGSLSECPISVGDLKELLNILEGEDK